MDKTEQFIKMSDCPEVQKYRKGQKDFQIGDLIANYFLGKYSKANFQGIVIFKQHDEIRDRQLAVWLPRQDDIQKMMAHTQPGILAAEGIALQLAMENDTWEKFWLAFYMYEEHSKIWLSKEEKWVKE